MDRRPVCLATVISVLVQLSTSSLIDTSPSNSDRALHDVSLSTTEPTGTSSELPHTTLAQPAVLPMVWSDGRLEDFKEDTFYSNEALGMLPRWEASRLRGEGAALRVRRDSIVVRPLGVTRSRGALATRQRDAKKQRGKQRQAQPGNQPQQR